MVQARKVFQAGDFGIDATDAVVVLVSVPEKSKKFGGKRPLLPSVPWTAKAPTAERRYHPRRHERVAEGFRLAFTSPYSVL